MENQIEEVANTPPKKEKGKNSFMETMRFVFVALIIVVPIRFFVAQPFVVSGSSMYPTFTNGDYLIVDELSYHLGKPERNDVVIFRYPKDPKKFFIKRIIGLPGETVNINGSIITITNKENMDGFVLIQDYIKNTSSNNIHFELKDNEYYVMGDNRSASSDSRYWGAVPSENIIGKAFLRLYPLDKIDIMPGKFE